VKISHFISHIGQAQISPIIYTLAKHRHTVDQHRRELLAISISHISHSAYINGINALIYGWHTWPLTTNHSPKK